MKEAKKSMFLWAKVSKRGEFEDGGIVPAEEYAQAYQLLMEKYGYDSNATPIWMTDVTEDINAGRPVSLTAFIRQQVLYLRKGESSGRKRKKNNFSD